VAVTLVSIDVETTGKDPKTCQIIEFGAVIDDWSDVQPLDKLPTFQSFIRHDQYICEPFAAWMNQDIFGKLSGAIDLEKGESIGTPGEVFARFYQFLIDNGYKPSRNGFIHFIPAGKNYQSFDELFLKAMEPWTNRFRSFRRIFDPTILYYEHDDDEPPDTDICIARAGGPIYDQQHRAIPDAKTVLHLLRYKLL